MLNAQHFLELNIVEPAEADIVEDQQDLPTLSSEDMMKLGLIAQVKEDHSPLPPNRKRRISQADILEEQQKALKLQQEMLELKKTKLRMEILLITGTAQQVFEWGGLKKNAWREIFFGGGGGGACLWISIQFL